MIQRAWLAALCITALPMAGESPRFTVEEDDVLSSAWTITVVRETELSTLTLMDDEKDIGGGSSSTRTISLELLDEFGEVGEDGSPSSISRSFETLESVYVAGDSGDENESESELTGETVVFSFDPDSEEWTSAFGEDSEGEDDWLEDLAPRVDLAAVLPDSESEVGDTWEVNAGVLGNLLEPGGTVFVQESEDDDSDDEEGTIHIVLPGGDEFGTFEDFEGELTATLEEVTEEDDLRLAKILLAVDVEADLDITDELEERAADRGVEESYSEASVVRSFEGEVTILWDLDAHRPYSLAGELNGFTELRAEWSVGDGEVDLEIGYANEVSSTHTLEATFGD